jgi:two-component sensor histidine kinase
MQSADGSRIVEDLLPVACAAKHARDVVTDSCLRWDFPELVGPASLIASELVSNVVDHAQTMMTLEVEVRGPYLHVAVHDGSGLPPVLELDSDPGGTRGLGLRLVSHSSNAWGYTRQQGGKVVWATLAHRLSPRAGGSRPAWNPSVTLTTRPATSPRSTS